MPAVQPPAGPMPEGLLLQPRAARTLERALRARSSHAFLLGGPPSTGTFGVALWLAAAVLCPNGGGDGCDTCRRVQRLVHPDLIHLRPEGQQLLREHVDRLVEQLVRKPFEATAQVAVIEDAHTLSATNPIAGNALLKVLEEPPGDVLFVLLATRPAQMLPTLRSRVIEIPFPPVADAVLRQHLLDSGVDGGPDGLSLDALVRVARGEVDRARELAAGGPALQRHRSALAAATGLAQGRLLPADAAAVLLGLCDAAGAAAANAARAELEQHAERLPPKDAKRFRESSDPDAMEARIKRRARRATADEVRALAAELGNFYRDLLVARAGVAEAIVNADHAADIVALAAAPAAARAVAALDAIEELPARLVTNVDLPLAMGALCAELASLANDRIRARRAMGATARSAQGLELALG